MSSQTGRGSHTPGAMTVLLHDQAPFGRFGSFTVTDVSYGSCVWPSIRLTPPAARASPRGEAYRPHLGLCEADHLFPCRSSMTAVLFDSENGPGGTVLPRVGVPK